MRYSFVPGVGDTWTQMLLVAFTPPPPPPGSWSRQSSGFPGAPRMTLELCARAWNSTSAYITLPGGFTCAKARSETLPLKKAARQPTCNETWNCPLLREGVHQVE